MLKKNYFMCIFLTIIFILLGAIGFYYNNLLKYESKLVNDNIKEVTFETIVESNQSDNLKFEITKTDSKYNTTFKNDIYYYNQNDYANIPYGTYGTIKGYGCGPTAMAMILSSFTKTSITPIETTKFACDNGYCSENGTNSRFFLRIAQEYNLVVEGPLDTNDIDNQLRVKETLESGKSLVIMSVGDGYFYKGGHYLVVAKSNNGNIQVLDPNSVEKTTTYTFDFLMSQVVNPKYFYVVKEGE